MVILGCEFAVATLQSDCDFGLAIDRGAEGGRGLARNLAARLREGSRPSVSMPRASISLPPRTAGVLRSTSTVAM